MSSHPPTAIRTASGRLVDLAAFRPKDVLLADIATSLAHQERYTGHCPLRPTVAQHSLAVEHIAAELWHRQQFPSFAHESNALSRAALMHDAAEAYVSDLSTPMKRTLRRRLVMSSFDLIEAHIKDTIDERFDCAYDGFSSLVHEADQLAYAYESAYANWNTTAVVPAWLAHDQYVARCYDERASLEDDGGEAAFLRRAAVLGMRDA